MPPSIKIASPKDSKGINSNIPGDLALLQSIEQLVNDWKHHLVESPAMNRSASNTNDALSTSDPFSSNQAIAIYEKHERFYFPLKHIYFVVENIMYSVPRAPFDSHSPAFTGQGLTSHEPLILTDVSAAQFDHFLSVLHPTEYGVYSATTVEDWTSILHLSDKWGFHSIRTLAIKHLAPVVTDVDKIVLGRRYGMGEWLEDAYRAVCMREESLTREEGRRIGIDDAVEINAIRQHFGLGTRPKSMLSLPMREVQERFGLLEPNIPLIGLRSKAAVPAADAEMAELSSADPPAIEPTLHSEAAVAVPVQSSYHPELPVDSDVECSPPTHDNVTAALSQWLAELSSPVAEISGSSEGQCDIFADSVASVAGPKLPVLVTERTTFSSSQHEDQLTPLPPSTGFPTEVIDFEVTW